jgi:hypothetical protein
VVFLGEKAFRPESMGQYLEGQSSLRSEWQISDLRFAIFAI